MNRSNSTFSSSSFSHTLPSTTSTKLGHPLLFLCGLTAAWLRNYVPQSLQIRLAMSFWIVEQYISYGISGYPVLGINGWIAMRFHRSWSLSLSFTSLGFGTVNSFSVIGTGNGRKRSGKIDARIFLTGEQHVLKAKHTKTYCLITTKCKSLKSLNSFTILNFWLLSL